MAFRPTQVPEELVRRAYDFILRIPRGQSHLAMASLLSGLTAEMQLLVLSIQSLGVQQLLCAVAVPRWPKVCPQPLSL